MIDGFQFPSVTMWINKDRVIAQSSIFDIVIINTFANEIVNPTYKRNAISINETNYFRDRHF